MVSLPVPPPPAETPMGDHFLFEPAAINPADSAFSVVTSQHHTRYGYRGNGCFQDGNRNGYSPMPDSGESRRPGRDPSSWNVDDVVWFIRDADPQALGPHAEAFRKHEIDGGALLLLKSETMMKYLGLKLGPALKLCFHIDRLKQNRL
uniref:SAM domain-containing protein n=1 Tax=Stegastes partitus TaxID=144197 RepID=A0A3B5BP01_9TELE